MSPPNCPACGAAFPNEAALREHGAQAHPMRAAAAAPHAAFDCKACGAHFHSEIELKQHGGQAHRM